MLDEAEYASDTDESDDDYRPDGNGENAASEIESDGEPEDDIETDAKCRSNKRPAPRATSVQTKRSKQSTEESNKKTIEKDQLADDDDDDNEDALWASFLSGTGQTATKPDSNSKQKEIQTSKTSSSTSMAICRKNEAAERTKTTPAVAATTEKKKIVTEIFDFAGEKVEVQKEIVVNDEKTTTASQPDASSKTIGKAGTIPPLSRPKPGGGGGGGLSSVLGQLGKKNKLSVLEKSKIDWSGFKQNEGIDEELQTFNKGRDGYLERQDFLQRTDLRQFEIEKSMRQTNRRK